MAVAACKLPDGSFVSSCTARGTPFSKGVRVMGWPMTPVEAGQNVFLLNAQLIGYQTADRERQFPAVSGAGVGVAAVDNHRLGNNRPANAGGPP